MTKTKRKASVLAVSVFLTAVMITVTAVLLPVSAQEPNTEPMLKIISFEEQSPTNLEVALGTAFEEISLPQSLSAWVEEINELDDEQGTVLQEILVEWECDDYDAGTPATYELTAKPQENTEFDGELPTALVEVKSAEKDILPQEPDKPEQADKTNEQAEAGEPSEQPQEPTGQIVRFYGNTTGNQLIRIIVDEGSNLQQVQKQMPAQVGVELADGSYVNANVSWQPTPGYSSAAGTYTFMMIMESDLEYNGELPYATVVVGLDPLGQ